ncbi:hypothetical protein EBR25_13370 [bacterium]|nr:hypothetical protein [bacterium]
MKISKEKVKELAKKHLKVEKNQLLPYVIAIGASATVVYMALNPRVEVVEKRVEVEKVVDRNKTTKRKETRPDGTVIETVINDESTTKTDTNSSIVSSPLPKYSLAIDYTLPRPYTDPTAYIIRGGMRLGDTPFHLDMSAGLNRFTIGVRFEF